MHSQQIGKKQSQTLEFTADEQMKMCESQQCNASNPLWYNIVCNNKKFKKKDIDEKKKYRKKNKAQKQTKTL